MSYDIELTSGAPGEVLHMPDRFTDGGTYCVGGTDECHLNVTYNYHDCFKRVFPATLERGYGHISWLYGKTGAETIDVLRSGVELLGTERGIDYWQATAGNAGAALARLLSFAEAHPEGVWEGD